MKAQIWNWGILTLTLGSISTITPAVSAQSAVQGEVQSAVQTASPLIIWDIQAAGTSKIGPWGNGSAQISQGRSGNSLLIKTLNFEEGARFDLAKPIDLTPYGSNGFWRLKLQVNGSSQRGRGTRTRSADGTSQEPRPLSQLRLKLELERGVMAGFVSINPSSRGAQNLLIPFKNFYSSKGAGGLLRRIILTGDSEASFNLEQIALVTETNRITATVRRSIDPIGTDSKTITVKPGRSTTLIADVNGGTADLSVRWNFNADNSVAFPPAGSGRNAGGRTLGGRTLNGQITGGRNVAARGRVDAEGLTARPNWPNEEQDYRVEVTISDKAGKKATVKRSLMVQVRAGS